MGDPRIDGYRQPWESDEHWTLRKEFIERFRDDFPEDRLLCLAQVYSNVELLGCSYPAPVMRQMRELSKGLRECTVLRDKRKERAAVQFVKEKQKAPSRNSFNNSGECSQKRSRSESKTDDLALCKSTAKKIKISDSGSSSNSAEICTSFVSGTTSSNLNTNKHFLPSNNLCEKGAVDCVNAGQNSSKNAVQKLDSKSQDSSGETVLILDILPKGLKDNFIDILQFIRKSLTQQLTPTEILNNMAQKFGLKIEYDLKVSRNTHECSLKIDNVLISNAKEISKKKARSEASRIAVDLIMRPLSKASSTCSSDLSKPCLYDSEASSNQKCAVIASELNADTVTNVGTCGNDGWCNDGIVNSSNIVRNTSVLNSNDHCSLISKNAHRDQNFDLNSGSHCNPFNRSVSTPSTCHNSVPAHVSSPKICIKRSVRGVSVKQSSKNTQNSNTPSSFPEFLVIIDNSDVTKSDRATAVFTSSAHFNHVPFQYEYETSSKDAQIITKAQIALNDHVLCCAFGENKQAAKEAVSKAAIEILRKTAYTIKVKDEHQDGFIVSRNQLFNTDGSNNSIADSNIGCKMLKLMGWSGGGIGKDGKQGIEEPVKATEKHKFGQGLGYIQNGGADASFTARAEQMIQDYAKSNSTSDMIFSTEFSKEERKEIHKLACKYGLKSNSKGGKGDGRHLIISKRYTARGLVNQLQQCGGRTHKYELIPPTG